MDDAPGVAGDLVFVCDQDDGQPLLAVELLEHVEDLDAGARVEVAGRLVGEEEGGVVDEGAGDGDALLLAAGELGRLVFEPIGQADVSLNNGGLRLTHELDFDLSGGTSVGGSPALVYNSSTVNVHPLITFAVDDAREAPSAIEITGTWRLPGEMATPFDVTQTVPATSSDAARTFLFTVERCDDDVGFALGQKRRWQHSEPYLRAVAATAGLEVVGLVACAPRTEANKPVDGLAVGLRKPG